MANTIEYKGYIGTVEYSSEDKCFFGKVALVDDLVTFEAQNAVDLEVNFQNAVDGYIQACKKLKREPKKRFKGVFNVRIGEVLHEKALKNALSLGVSLNAYMKNLIEKDGNFYLSK